MSRGNTETMAESVSLSFRQQEMRDHTWDSSLRESDEPMPTKHVFQHSLPNVHDASELNEPSDD